MGRDPLIQPENEQAATCGNGGGFAGHPRGLSTLFFTEIWERFSYYGMRALLMLFMVAPVAQGGLGFATPDAALIYGNYTMAVYMLAIPGGLVADRFIGARHAVLVGGMVLATGHFALAWGTLPFFYAGLVLIALGTGLFKPSISAMVGGLYAPADVRRDAGFSIFYMGINIGGFAAPLITGFLAQNEIFKGWLAGWGFEPSRSWHWGFAAAGVGMVLGLFVYLSQGRRIAHLGRAPNIDARAWGQAGLVLAGTAALFGFILVSDRPEFQWLRSLFLLVPVAAVLWFSTMRGLEPRRTAAMFVFFIAAMIFWAIFEQAGLSIALFADQLTKNEVFGFPFPSAWFQSLNPLFVIALAPLFALAWMRLGARQPSAPVKFSLGLFFLGLSFLLMVPAAHLTAQGKVSPLWLAGLFLLQTIGELFLSPVGLSAMTKLAPARLVGLALGLWFLAVAFGNKLAGVLGATFDSGNPSALAAFFWQQAGLVALAALLLLVLAPWVRGLMSGVR